MSKTYAIADLHGRFDLLEMALARITERADPPATVVTLGDYVDRGPDSRKIVERLMAGLGRDGWQLICLKGNHEDATLYTGTISIHMGRSSKRTGPTLTRLRGTPVGLQSASLMTLRPVDRSKFSKSTASRLRRYYRADGPYRLLQQSGEPTKLSSREALLGIFETMCRRIFGKTRVNRDPCATAFVARCLSRRHACERDSSRAADVGCTRQPRRGARLSDTTVRHVRRLYLRASFPLSITTMTEATSSILGHYGAEDLVNRIMRALAAAGYNTVSPTVEMLNLIDQLHGGGLNSTKVQAEMAGVAKDMRILDAGCGVGGSSRYLAHTYRCQVEAIDLTPQYVEAAVRLNELCGLDKKIVVRQGSVTDLPYTDRTCFDDPKRT
jgi:hypothetical protein